MSHTITVREAEAQCREFALECPTPNVLRAISLAEHRVLSWFDVYELFRSAAKTAVDAR
jgi:hypothetical protein